MNIVELLTKQEKNKLSIKTFSKNDTLFKEGEKCLKIGIVLSGEVKISTFSSSGKEVVFNIVKDGEMFGSNLIFSSDPYYKGYVVSTKNTKVMFINKDELLSIFNENNKFLIFFLNIQSDITKSEKILIELLTIPSAKERFLFFLKENNYSYTYDSISSLATRLNLSREALSRTISGLLKENKIKKKGKTLSYDI